MQLFPPDDERLSLETCRGGKINTLKKVKKCVKLVENPQLSMACIYVLSLSEKSDKHTQLLQYAYT
jgi:hypothetical protein